MGDTVGLELGLLVTWGMVTFLVHPLCSPYWGECISQDWVMLPGYLSWAGDGAVVCVSPQEQRLVEDSTREVKKVRKARNRRLEWNMMAYDKEFRPDNRFSPSPYHMASSEGSLSPDNRQVLPPTCLAHQLSFAFLFSIFGGGTDVLPTGGLE